MAPLTKPPHSRGFCLTETESRPAGGYQAGVWRLVKSDSIGVSFGYLVKDQDAGDGTRLLKSIDLYEISLTATPMHGSTRVVSWKSAETGTSTSSTDADWEGFQAATRAADRTHEEANRKREQQERGEQLVKEILEETKAKEAAAAKKARPIKVKTFEV